MLSGSCSPSMGLMGTRFSDDHLHRGTHRSHDGQLASVTYLQRS